MELPEEVLNLKLKKIYCETCISFDQKTQAYCFLTKGKCSPKKEACQRIRPRENKEGKCEKSGTESTMTEHSG